MKKHSFEYSSEYIEEKSLFIKAINIIKREGIFHLLYDAGDLIIHYLTPRKSFHFNGKKYKVFRHWYNPTWRGDREIEIAVTLDLLKRFKRKKILEIGNVINYYTPFSHTVVDKYEVAPGVINEDAATFKPAEKYDLIFSISTVEHIGWDEKPKQPEKVLAAIKNLKKLLTKNGTFFFTAPFGYNLYLDRMIIENKVKFNNRWLMIKEGNNWKQIPFEQYRNILKNKEEYHVLVLATIKN